MWEKKGTEGGVRAGTWIQQQKREEKKTQVEPVTTDVAQSEGNQAYEKEQERE